MSKMHMGYNRMNQVPTLVGNWQEERILLARTGYSRNQIWQEEEEQQVFATRRDIEFNETPPPTLPRVVEHDNALFEEEWRSTCQVSFRNPSRRTTDICTYPRTQETGIREQKETEELEREAEKLTQKIPQSTNQFETVYRTQYTDKDRSNTTVGQVVMKTQDGGEVKRDPIFLGESKIISPSAAGRYMQQQGPQTTFKSQILPNQQLPITFYSEKAASNTYAGTLVYGTTVQDNRSPFSKNSNFSKPITDYSKVLENE